MTLASRLPPLKLPEHFPTCILLHHPTRVLKVVLWCWNVRSSKPINLLDQNGGPRQWILTVGVNALRLEWIFPSSGAWSQWSKPGDTRERHICPLHICCMYLGRALGYLAFLCAALITQHNMNASSLKVGAGEGHGLRIHFHERELSRETSGVDVTPPSHWHLICKVGRALIVRRSARL